MEVSGRANGVSFSEMNNWEQDEKILQPFTHVLKASSKERRAKLFKAFNYWLNVPADKFDLLQEVLQMYHIGTLLIDDIQDNTFLRRGIPAAHKVHGFANTISAAICVHLMALQKVLSFNHPEMMKLYTGMNLDLWRGQTMEIFWRDNLTCPSEGEYLEMVKRKSSGTFIFGVQMMQLCSENKTDFTKLTGTLGRFFQIGDDYCDLCLQEYSQKKSYSDDITEGKFSFPIIHAIKSHQDDNQVSSILRQRTGDAELKKYFVSLLEKFGSLKYTRHTLEDLDAEIRAEVAKLGGNPMLEDVLDELVDLKGGTVEKH